MIYIERKPSTPLLRHFVSTLWYARGSSIDRVRERILPSGCAHIVLNLAQDYLTECAADGQDRHTSPALFVGQRSQFEIISTTDLMDMAGALFVPGTVPAFVADRADLL